MKESERPRVLVVEDEFIIALDLSETVKDLGYKVEGPFVSKKTAFSAYDSSRRDGLIAYDRRHGWRDHLGKYDEPFNPSEPFNG